MRTLFLIFVVTNLFACATSNNVTNTSTNFSKAAHSYYTLGLAYLQKGNYELAESKLQRSLQLQETADGYNALALLYESQHKNSLAEAAYTKLLKKYPQYQRGYLNYHIFLCKNDRNKQMQQLVSIMTAPENNLTVLAHIATGNCALTKKQYNIAKSSYQQALVIAPQAANALLPLAEIAFHNKEIEKASAYIKQIHNYNGYNARSVYLAMQINKAQGNMLEVQKMYNILKTQYPQSEEAQKIVH